MKRFGIEIRKAGTMPGLYQDVDRVLSDVPKGFITREIQVQTVAHALQQMMKTDSSFSICAIRDCIKVCQIYISAERMNVYSAMHCVGWNEMLPEFRTMLIAMVLDDFRSILNPTVELEEFDIK